MDMFAFIMLVLFHFRLLVMFAFMENNFVMKLIEYKFSHGSNFTSLCSP